MYMTVMMCDKWHYINAQEHINVFDGDEMHCVLLGCIGESRADASLLYRIIETNEVLFLYIQSDVPFPPESLSRYGFSRELEVDVDMKVNESPVGSMFSFNLLTVPTKVNAGSGKRIYLTSDAEIKDWFLKKAVRSGFSSEDGMCRIEKKSVIRFSRRQKDSKTGGTKTKTVTAPCVVISGCGIVEDRELFEKTVRFGFGKLKNFGAGLLLVG